MLHILFLVLKIIGIVLLVILGIILALASIVLFVPVRYCIKAETTDGVKGLRLEARVTWLFHLISAFVTYKEQETDWKARIAWKKLHVSESEPEQKTTSPNADTESKEVSEEKPAPEGASDKVEPKETNKEKESAKADKKKENWLEKLKCTIRSICDKIKKIKDYLMEETHIQALLRIKNELFIFIRRIRPNKVKGYIRFGLEDPYNTGRVLAVLSMLYPFYGEDLEIYPEFDEEIIEADVFIKGRIHFIHLVILVCKIYFDENIKVAYKNLKALKE